MFDSRPRSPAGGARRRILFLVGQFGFGGSERQLFLLLSHLDLEAWEPRVLVFHPSPNADYAAHLEGRGLRVVLPTSRSAGTIGKLAATIRVARTFKPHVVQSWTVHDNPYARLAATVSGAKICWGSLRGSTRLQGFRTLPAWYRKLALRSVQRLVVNSGALADELFALDLQEDRVTTLHNCVESILPENGDEGPRLLGEFGFGAEYPVFGCVGNIRRVKNQLLFVRAFADVITRHPEARGMIVGETLKGEAGIKQEIEREISRRDLSGKIVLTGFRDDVPRLIREFSAVCMTSDNEGMPNVVLEAMAAGTPIISTRVGGVADVVRDGETGFLIETGDIQGLAAAMCRIIDAPGESAEMAERALHLVREEWSCDSMARNLEAAYFTALDRRPGFRP